MKNIIVVGYKGKMGSVVFNLLQMQGYKGLGKEKGDDFADYDNVWLVIDFGGAESSVESARWCKQNKVKLIVGSTGQNENQIKEIYSAGKVISLVFAGNFSIGVLMMKKMIDLMKNLEIDDVCVLEKHHKNKKDSPSGTAKELKAELENFISKPVQVICERGGEEIGTHSIDFYFGSEVLSVEHRAFSRNVFANGVCLAVEFLKNKNLAGVFSFADVFDKMSKKKNF